MGNLDPFGFLRATISALIILLLIIHGSEADACKKGCSARDGGKLNYQPGNVYHYNFDSSVTISLHANTAEETSIKVNGAAQLFAHGNCGYTLKLNRVVVNNNNNNYEFKEDLEKPVQFSLTNGELDSQICADENDSDFSLNIKKALISMFQSTNNKYETDVFGRCPTTHSVTQAGNTEVVTKLRNLNQCSYRETLSNGFVFNVINEKSGVKSLPLLDSDYRKDQKIKNGIVENVDVLENYKFEPFSNSDAAVRAKVVTHLKLGQVSRASPPSLRGVSKSIIFKKPEKLSVDYQNNIEQLLKKIITEFQKEAGPNAAGQFVQLIRLMRYAKFDELLRLYQKTLTDPAYSDKQLAKKVYLDALFRTGTGQSVQAIINLLKQGQLAGTEVTLAYMSFNIVNSMTKEALDDVDGLLDSNPPNVAYLSIGNLVNVFCKQTDCKDADIESISKKFVNKLNKCSYKTQAEQDTVIYILKGIRNTHKIASSAVESLAQCTTNKNPARVRVAALQAFRAASCQKNVQNVALNILKNRNEDSELRIEAYLAVVACPNAQVANQIADIINSETVYQVGTFITTHLQNIRASTDPYRESARYHLANIRPTKKFPFDPRRYSFNQELSYAFESLGVGASEDSNVIFSQNSFLPRSVSLNLTGEIFGYNFNILELSGRQENLETLLEYYLGPKGLFSENSPQELVDTVTSYISNRDKREVRRRRSFRNEVENFAKRVKFPKEQDNTDLSLDLSVKMFGNEMFFLSLGDNIVADPKEMFKKGFQHTATAKDALKSFSYNYQFHTLFLDNELTYPTSIGFPLELAAQGAAAARLPIEGNFDVNTLLKEWKKSNFRLKFVPSASFDLSGTLKVDGFVLSTGLKISGLVHTSTGSDVTFKFTDDGNGFDLDIDLPSSKQQIFRYEHNIELITEKNGAVTELVTGKSRKTDAPEYCFDQLLKPTGFTLCCKSTLFAAHNELNTAPFPLNGPAEFALFLDTYTKFQIKGRQWTEGSKNTWELKYDTPGSDPSRDTTLKLEISTLPQLSVGVLLQHPLKTWSAEVGMNNDDKEFTLYGKHQNDAKQSSVKIGFAKHKESNREIYEPLVLLVRDGKQQNDINGYSATGKIYASKTQNAEQQEVTKYEFDNFNILNPENEKFNLNGWVEYKGQPYSLNSKLVIETNQDTHDLQTKFEFSAERILYDGTIKNQQNRNLNSHLKFERTHNETGFSNTILVAFGPDLRQSYEFSNSWNVDKVDSLKVAFTNKLKIDPLHLLVKLDGLYGQNTLNYDFETKLQNKRIASNLKLIRNAKSVGDLDGELSLVLNKYNVNMKAKRVIENLRTRIDHSLTSNFGLRVSVNGHMAHKYTLQDADINLRGDLALTEKESPYSWSFIFTGKVGNTHSTGKLLQGRDELFHYTVDVNRAETVTGNFNFVVKNFVNGKGDLQDNNGKGNAQVLLTFDKLNKKVKVETNYNIASPTYDVDTDVYYDFEADNNKKVSFSTKNNVESHSFDTKNVLMVDAEKYTFDADGKYTGDALEGDVNGKFSLTLPNGRNLRGDINRKFVNSNGVSSGHGILNVHDAKPEGVERSFVVDLKAKEINLKSKFFDVEYVYTFTDFDRKTFIVSTNLKHLPKDQFKMIEAKLNVRGSAVTEEFGLDLNVDEYCEIHAVFHGNTRYGQHLNANFNGNYHVGNSQNKVPTRYELRANLHAPETELKTFKLETSGSFLLQETDNRMFEGNVKFIQTFGDQSFRLDIAGNGNQNQGSYDIMYHVPKYEEARVKVNYLREESNDVGKYHVDGSYNYGPSDVYKLSADLTEVKERSVSLHYVLQSSQDKFQNVDLLLKIEKSGDSTYTTSSQLTYGSKVYSVNNVLTLSDQTPSFDLTMVYPDNTAKLYGAFERLGERSGKVQARIDNLGEFKFDGAVEANFQNFDDFYLKIDLDSHSLKLNQVHIEANSKVNPNGKAVEFKATEASKNILSGSAQYTVKTERAKTSIEGRGDIQLYDKPSTANFKLIRNTYVPGRDKETGFSYRFDGSFGSKNIVSELKFTSKTFKVKLASCEEKRPCTNFELLVVSTVDQNQYGSSAVPPQYKVMMLVDLRELGYPYEFELHSETTRIGFALDHELEINVIANNNNKYKFNFYLKPKKSGLQFLLPTREIALEAVYAVPKAIFGRYEGSISLFLDKKRKPNEVTLLSFTADVDYVESKSINGQTTLKFVHPTIRTLAVVGALDINREQQFVTSSVEFDVFKTPDQKVVLFMKYQNQSNEKRGFNITSEAYLRSSGLDFEYSYNGHSALSLERREFSSAYSLTSSSNELKVGSYVLLTPEQFEVLLTGLNEKIFHATGTYDTKRNVANLQSTYKLLGSRPIILTGVMQGLSSFTLNLKRDDQLFNVDAKIISGKEASLTVLGNSKTLFIARIALKGPDLMSTEYKVNEAEVESFIEAVQEKVRQETEESRNEIDRRFQSVQQLYKRQYEKIQHSVPDFSGLYASYENEMNSLFEELSADPNIQEFIKHFKRIYEAFNKIYETILKTFGETYNKLYEVQHEFYAKTLAVYKERILPALQNVIKSIVTLLGKIHVEIMKLSKHVFEHVFKILKIFENYLSKFGTTLSEVLKKVAGLVGQFVDTLQKELNDIINLVVEYSNSLPGFDELKARWVKFTSSWSGWKQLSNVASEILRTLSEILPTEECKDFVKLLNEYLTAKLNNAETNDVENLKSLYVSFVEAIRSIIVNFNFVEPSNTIFSFSVPNTWSLLKKLPSWTTGKSSIFNYFRTEELSNLNQVLLQRFQFDMFPPYEMRGHIADGQHIFTFDGRHLTYPGSCSYVLAQDFKHGNFSLIGTMENGKMKSVTLVDKENTIEVNNQGNVKLNEKNADFPIHKDNIHSWRRYYTVSILTKYGVKVTCTLDLRVCHFNVNGYYLGRTRGVLGNGNQEPYDDFLLPNGKITESYADFGNAYSLRSCRPVPYVDHSGHEASPLCKELFGSQSLLALGYLFIDHHAYYEACQHAVATADHKNDAACNIALAYASAGQLERIPLQLPPQCAKCEERNIGQDFEIVTKDKADIILVVDKEVLSESPQFLKHLVDTLKKKFNERNIPDAKVVVIGYHQNEKYPSLFTFNGKLDTNGNIPLTNTKGPEKEYLRELVTGDMAFDGLLKQVQEFINKTILDSADASDSNAFQLAMAYPFRPDAHKVIVAIRGDTLEYSNVLKLFEAAIVNELVKFRGISLHLVAPVVEIEPPKLKHLVGFNLKHVITLQDSGKSSNLGSSELRSKLKYKSDMGIDIVQSDGGYVYSLSRYRDLDKLKQKATFAAAIANSLADHTSRTEINYQCTCTLSYGLHAEESCMAKQTKLNPAK